MSTAGLEKGSGRSRVSLAWQPVGNDIQIIVTGGELPHVGAIAVAYVENREVVALALTVPGHMETELALEFAKDICGMIRRPVAVTCGIHIDGAGKEEIALLCENARSLKIRLAGELRGDVE